jgi:hypothetical protein
MIKQYPHVLYGVATPGDSTRDTDGNWNTQVATTPLLSVCREETNGRGREIQGTDGKFYKYASVVFLPISCADIAFGRTVYVKDSTTATIERIRGTVLKFDRGQMHCRLWV